MTQSLRDVVLLQGKPIGKEMVKPIIDVLVKISIHGPTRHLT